MCGQFKEYGNKSGISGKKVKNGHIFAKYGEFNITQESTRLVLLCARL